MHSATGNEWYSQDKRAVAAVIERRDAIRATLRGGGVLFGTWVKWCRNPTIMQMLREAGLEFAFIDTQHTGLSWETLADMCQMARECGVVPIIRPYEHARGLSVRLRDIGAMGLIYPNIDRPDQVSSIWEWMNDENRDDEFLLFVQIESVQAASRIDQILDAGRIDVVWIGRHDLSNSLGLPSHESVRHPRVIEVADAVIAACRARRVATAAGAYSHEDAEDLMARGVQCLSWGSDHGVLLAALREASLRLHDSAAAVARVEQPASNSGALAAAKRQ